MTRAAAFLLLLGFTNFLEAQIVVFEEHFETGIPASWTNIDNDTNELDSAVMQYGYDWFDYTEEADTCAGSTSYFSPAGQNEDYLITPKLTLPTFSKLVWSARSVDASYPDGYLVLISDTDSLPASFTDTVFVQTEEFSFWQTRSVQLDLEGYANQDVYIAFLNNTTDGFILLLDDVNVLGSDFAGVLEDTQPAYAVYPNPATATFTITDFNPGDQVAVYHISGSLVLQTDQATVDVSGLESGTYLIRISGQSGAVSLPFIKQ
jgi:hypothetical protein